MKKNAKSIVSLLVATLMITTSIIVLADWDPSEDGHKMHFPQLPDPNGWDILACHPEIVADDWLCTESGNVSNIHFWGSWLFDIEGIINGFWITIFADIPDPDGPGPLYSMPGEILWNQYITDFDILFWDASPQGWYEPIAGWWQPDNHLNYYQYNLMNITEPF